MRTTCTWCGRSAQGKVGPRKLACAQVLGVPTPEAAHTVHSVKTTRHRQCVVPTPDQRRSDQQCVAGGVPHHVRHLPLLSPVLPPLLLYVLRACNRTWRVPVRIYSHCIDDGMHADLRFASCLASSSQRELASWLDACLVCGGVTCERMYEVAIPVLACPHGCRRGVAARDGQNEGGTWSVRPPIERFRCSGPPPPPLLPPSPAAAAGGGRSRRAHGS